MDTSAYHVKATLLPEGGKSVDIWIVDGKYTFSPVAGAIELPGAFMAAGMVDGHAHLSLDFANTGLPPGTAELVLHNAKRHLRSS
ncbi:MAG: hypothetical protein CFE32_16120 [Alphaproteobacteria bacterium PA3]|nr:MAG: hypothetical protein CFE32_16120 [Alphaproteobacteria bacterium PA3]